LTREQKGKPPKGGRDQRAGSLGSRLALEGPVSILINNLGGSPPEAYDGLRFEQQPASLPLAYLAINLNPMLRMTHMLIGRMVDRDIGSILNVASPNGLCPSLRRSRRVVGLVDDMSSTERPD